MTEQELVYIGGAMIVFAAATERLMGEVLKIEKQPLTHEAKQMWNGMQRGVRNARYYYEQFTDRIGGVLCLDNQKGRYDQMRREGDDMIRMYLRIVNADRNGHLLQHIENSIRKLAAEENMAVSEEVIERFRINNVKL